MQELDSLNDIVTYKTRQKLFALNQMKINSELFMTYQLHAESMKPKQDQQTISTVAIYGHHIVEQI